MSPDHQPAPDADPIDAEGLRVAGRLGSVEVLTQAASTMDRGREIAADPAATLPAAVVADRQTAGRGRRGAAWWQPPGSLAVSLVVAGTVSRDGPRPASRSARYWSSTPTSCSPSAGPSSPRRPSAE